MSVALVDAWLSEVMHSLQNGKRCLVLYGPSRLDKTEVVRALFGVGSIQEFNCAGLVSICLHSFDNLKHECLLWDEASPKLVADNRKVFQHPACKVKLGHSPTGQHAVHYFIWLLLCHYIEFSAWGLTSTSVAWSTVASCHVTMRWSAMLYSLCGRVCFPCEAGICLCLISKEFLNHLLGVRLSQVKNVLTVDTTY